MRSSDGLNPSSSRDNVALREMPYDSPALPPSLSFRSDAAGGVALNCRGACNRRPRASGRPDDPVLCRWLDRLQAARADRVTSTRVYSTLSLHGWACPSLED